MSSKEVISSATPDIFGTALIHSRRFLVADALLVRVLLTKLSTPEGLMVRVDGIIRGSTDQAI